MAHLSEEPDPEPVSTFHHLLYHFRSQSYILVLPPEWHSSVGAVAIGMPCVPASSYHSCLSLHRQLAFAVWACISSAHPLKRVYRLPRVVGTGISHRLPPEVYHILLFWLSLFQEMVDSSQEASKSFSTSMEEESTFGLWGLLIFQHLFKIHPTGEKEGESVSKHFPSYWSRGMACILMLSQEDGPLSDLWWSTQQRPSLTSFHPLLYGGCSCHTSVFGHQSIGIILIWVHWLTSFGHPSCGR